MGEGERAGHEIDGLVVHWEVLQEAAPEVGVGHLGPRHVEHGVSRVDADDAVPELGQLRRMAAGAAGGVERVAHRGWRRAWRARPAPRRRSPGSDCHTRRPLRVARLDVVLDQRDGEGVGEVVELGRDRADGIGIRRRHSGALEEGAQQRKTVYGEEVVTGEE